MQNAVAFSNNDVVIIAWSFGVKPEGCMGFAISRVDAEGNEEVLPSHAVFKGQEIQSGQLTTEFPVQKFYWKDPYARLAAEKTGNRTFRYKIVPMQGKPGSLTPMTHLPILTTNSVEVTPVVSKGVQAFFNRGLISTQRVARALKDASNKKDTLLEQVADPENPLRASLSGDMVEALTGFLDRAKTKGQLYAALYELGDKELLEKLVSVKDRLHIILADAKKTVAADGAEDDTGDEEDDGGTTKKKTKVIDSNQDARDTLDQEGVKEKLDRILPNSHIGHNKFVVYVDGQGRPRAVLLGSTNWTFTGLCTQTNNTLVVDDAGLAGRYLEYWKELAKDTKAADGEPKLLQGSVLRDWDATPPEVLELEDGSTVESWFSPNTPKARSSKHTNEATPPDMAAVTECINNAKEAILFLVFYPGTPSVANWIGQAQRKNKKLFVRGCVTNKSASQAFYYELKGMTPPPKVKGEKTPIKQDYRVFGAEAFDSKHVPPGWVEEILNAGFAIIHDKIVVIDPFSDNPVVITGSHNEGHKASYDNDENLVIVKGNQKLALAYTTHVLDVYDHFSARYWAHNNGGKPIDLTLKSKPDEWLSKYFDADGIVINEQLKFWLRANVEPTA